MNTNYPRILLAGTNSRVGKTTLTIGLIAALKKRGLIVQPFKAGPDYIDPSYHTYVSGKSCRNLDSWMLSKNALLELFQRQAGHCDISVVEGVMGLYDGVAAKEEGSSAHLAKILKAPVILLLDARSMSRSAAAVVLGYKEFDGDLDLRGVILNNIGSPAHYHSVKYSIEKNTGLAVLGFLPKDKNLNLPQRHLGLVPTQEEKPLKAFLKNVTRLVEDNIDLNRVIAIARDSARLPDSKRRLFFKNPSPAKVSIALAKDAAFNFYYQDNLDILAHHGARLIKFSPLKDKAIPPGVNGIYIGGGFPELFALRLSKNIVLRNDILKRAREGMPVYAECGGLIYLMKNIRIARNKNFAMTGVFDLPVKMGNKLSALGYVNIEVVRNNILSEKNTKVKAHLFHWSYLGRPPGKINFAYRAKKNGKVIDDGFLKWNVLASYAHLHFGANPKFAKEFIHNCQIHAKKNQ